MVFTRPGARDARPPAAPPSVSVPRPRKGGAFPSGAAEGVQGRSPLRISLDRFRRDRVAMASLAVLGMIGVFALLAPLWAGLTGHAYDATHPRTGLDLHGQPVGPGREFWLGADQLGRDVLVRAAYGARVSLLVGVASAALAVLAGTAAGLTAGYAGGALDAVLSRLMDATLALPYLLVAITLATVFPVSSAAAGTAMTIGVIAAFSFAAVGRVVRGQVLALRRAGFVEAARALGAGPVRIAVREVLPHLTSQLTVLTALLVPSAIVVESTLSFLGVGVRPPMPSWGGMLGEGAEAFQAAWWLLAVPGVLLLAATLCCNLLGDGVRDALGPEGGSPGGVAGGR
jgi:ABC-type dipeptide/oligopeptide/nickel transport system permease subunit